MTGGDAPGHAPVVSVVTPLFNSSAHIDTTLNSLREQTFTDWEAILVDDGSTDATAEHVQPFLDDERFSYVRQPNRGIAAARNRGIGAARGRWVALLDHDDRWKPDKLARQLEAAARHDWQIVCSDAIVVRDGESARRDGPVPALYSEYLLPEQRRALERPEDPTVDLFAHLIRMNFLCASTVLIRRSLFAEHGLLDPAVAPADDYDMWLRCMPQAAIGFVHEPLVEYVLHASNHSWKAVEMRTAAIRVVFRTLERCAGDEPRTRACEHSLTVHYAVLFQDLLRVRDHAAVAAQACRLGARGTGGLRILRRSWRMRNQVRAGF